MLVQWWIRTARMLLRTKRIMTRHVEVRVPTGGAGESYADALADALRCLQTRLPRAYGRVRMHVRAIGVDPNPGLPFLFVPGRIVVIPTNFVDRLPSDFVAGAIAHEATHAWLFDRGFSHVGRSLARIELICLREEERLVEHSDHSSQFSEWIRLRRVAAESSLRGWEGKEARTLTS